MRNDYITVFLTSRKQRVSLTPNKGLAHTSEPFLFMKQPTNFHLFALAAAFVPTFTITSHVPTQKRCKKDFLYRQGTQLILTYPANHIE